MTGYTKLFGTILGSSLWQSSKDTKILWVTLLAMAGRDGVAYASVPGLASLAGLSIQETETSLKALLGPDRYSRTKDNEGRRIEAVEGGWLLLNHAAYRRKMSADERREYKREKQREYRDRDASNSTLSTRGRSGHNAEADAKAKAEPLRSSSSSKGARKAARRDSSWIDFDATSELQATLVKAVEDLAEKQGHKTDESKRELLRALSHTPRDGAEMEGSIRHVSKKWISATLSAIPKYDRDQNGDSE